MSASQPAITDAMRSPTAQSQPAPSVSSIERMTARQALVDAIPHLIVTMGADGEVDCVNRPWRSFTGIGLMEMRGSGGWKATHPEDLSVIDATWVRARRDGYPFEVERRIRASDGSYRWHLTRVAPLQDAQETAVGWISTSTDIHHKRAYEESIRQANHELQQFAYVASHDLQEPLRMVTGYLSLLQRRCSGSLDAAANEYVGYAFDGAARMQTLIQQLLDFSRVGQGNLRITQVDSASACREALANLGAMVAQSRGAVSCGPLPMVWADRTQLVRLFQNLLHNALLYRLPDVSPTVRITAQPTLSEWIFCVHDNGIGIAAENQARIFDVFQRLHARDDYPGTGMGLAVCKKIVERHRGRLWVTSEPGQGSCFFFSLPVPTRVEA
ncbi:MAG: PAS domain S-box protein [Planctomycetes bacterium]|nr:PAS domain S-box protein [Planctomycetota bacterium]